MRISKADYERLGGMRNFHLYRKQANNGRWYYYASDLQMAEESAKCRYCDGEGRIETDNNGPVVDCPICT